eukprot:TRINITY_DN28980_c0_g2_i1.p1 TRINITY_DN28980_c0_g2~~TRINITY_DN28980_c0_g2_i1.p1  ORF type:complete len:271 (-),score=17.40 TRINITY_DN28980_c0_g2_i1:115-927(-)
MHLLLLPSLLVSAFLCSCLGHGVFWTPTSRAQLAQRSGWMQDTTKIIAEPMPEVAHGREYPGGRPFAEPGKSISNVGPCGRESYDSKKTNWNLPEHSWGKVQATYRAGQIIDVEWCVSDLADHGGVYSYRLCVNDTITSKFIDPSYTPTAADEYALEACFARGILSCSDVPGQSCPVHPDCKEGWGCMNSTDWFSCGPKDKGRCASKAVDKCSCHEGSGSLLRDKVKLPDTFVSKHTLIGFRWDCEDTAQLWVHCADIAIVAGDRDTIAV